MAEFASPEDRARTRVKDFTDVMWHVAAFVIINAFLWGLDIAGGNGVEWAYWPTIGWGIGVAFHVAYFFIGDEAPDNRRYRRYLEQERQREASQH